MTRSPADQDYQRRAIDYVRHVLDTTGMSPSGLARKAKVDPSTITRNLAGGAHKYTLSLKTIGRIAALTGIDPGPFIAIDPKTAPRATIGPLPALSGPEIARIRSAKGMSQADVAAAVGCHWVTISKLEAGRQKMTLDWLDRLAPVLGLGELSAAPNSSTAALTDLLAFLHLIRAEHRIDVPERHFETLRALTSQQTKAST